MPSPSLHPRIVLIPSIFHSIVQPLRNPFQCCVSVREEGRLSLQSQFSLPLPLCLKEYEIYNALSVHPVYVPLSPPELNVALGLSSSSAHLSTTPFSFVLRCPSSDASFVLHAGEWGVLLHSHRDILCERRVGGDEEAVSNEMEPKAAREDL